MCSWRPSYIFMLVLRVDLYHWRMECRTSLLSAAYEASAAAWVLARMRKAAVSLLRRVYHAVIMHGVLRPSLM
jgi:hypothetical protein